MEFIFILLLIFFFVLLYVVPAIIVIALLGLVAKWIVQKFNDYGEPNDISFDDYSGQWRCSVCGDSEDWHRHDP